MQPSISGYIKILMQGSTRPSSLDNAEGFALVRDILMPRVECRASVRSLDCDDPFRPYLVGTDF